MLYLYFIDLGSRLHIRIFLKSNFWIRNRPRGRFSYVPYLWRHAIVNAWFFKRGKNWIYEMRRTSA